MTWLLFSDSSTAVTIEPAKSYRADEVKLSSEYRAASGRPYRYNWGRFKRWSFPVEFVTSADITQINSWWYTGAKLLLKQQSDSAVYSVQITGAEEPVTRMIRPLRDFKRGAISLEAY